MEEKNKREEIQSRREFFKKAAKAALPVVGAAILSSVPFMNAEASTGCKGCYRTCTGSCVDSCLAYCAKTCNGCGSTCYKGCAVGCSGGCSGESGC